MLPLVTYPDPRLRKQSVEVTLFDQKLANFAQEMNVVMIAHDGIGLAAPQVGRNERVIIVKAEVSEYRVYVNPTITFYSKKIIPSEEGCLSIPGVFGTVKRSVKVHMKYQDIHGKKQTLKAKGMEAIILQHEVDHINGILILDRNITLVKGAEFLEPRKKR